MLESNRTGRIIYNLSLFTYLYIKEGGLQQVGVLASSRKRKKPVIFNAYLWRCNMAREIEIERDKNLFLFSIVPYVSPFTILQKKYRLFI